MSSRQFKGQDPGGEGAPRAPKLLNWALRRFQERCAGTTKAKPRLRNSLQKTACFK